MISPHIPSDLVFKITADSYRAWQLLRLTCRQYRDLLPDYNLHNDVKWGNVQVGHVTVMNMVKGVLMNYGTRAPAVYPITKKGHEYISMFIFIESPCPANSVLVVICDSDNIVCRIRDTSCDAHNIHVHNIHIHDGVRQAGLKITAGERYSLPAAMKYIRDNLPEVYLMLVPAVIGL
jgi:hypothetical protein